VLFVDPPAENLSYDYLVDGKRWQLKLAGSHAKIDLYQVNCHKNAGRVGGKKTYRQYGADDFDFLCIQLPEKTVDCCYVIPHSVLAERGIIGDVTRSKGCVDVYPHRRLTTRNRVYTAGVHWTEAYRINFADNPLADLARIIRGG
jgi:hypothetical protein